MSWGIETFGDNGNNYVTNRKFLNHIHTATVTIEASPNPTYWDVTIPTSAYPTNRDFTLFVDVASEPYFVSFVLAGVEMIFFENPSVEVTMWNPTTGAVQVKALGTLSGSVFTRDIDLSFFGVW